MKLETILSPGEKVNKTGGTEGGSAKLHLRDLNATIFPRKKTPTVTSSNTFHFHPPNSTREYSGLDGISKKKKRLFFPVTMKNPRRAREGRGKDVKLFAISAKA